jgi:hypothetical protein
MLFGIGFLTVITAAITSTFVARSRNASHPGAPTAEQLRQFDERLRQLDERLERIEAAVTTRPA